MYFKDCSVGHRWAPAHPAELGGRQAELLVLNERSKYRHVIDQEAPPAELAIVRTKQFRHTRKILENSTPTHEGGDDTWQNFLSGTQHYCYVPCRIASACRDLRFSVEKRSAIWRRLRAIAGTEKQEWRKQASFILLTARLATATTWTKSSAKQSINVRIASKLIDYEEFSVDVTPS